MQDVEAALTGSRTLRPTVARSAAAGTSVSPTRGPLRAALVTLRPRQWIKNLLVVGAAGAADALGHDDVPVRVGVTCAAFCLLASGIYCINDVRDAAEDRLHPRKCRRPIAAGELDPRAAGALGVLLLSVGMCACLLVRPLVALVAAGYVAVTLSYTLVWRRLLLLDIIAIAGGFVLRATAGGAAAPVTLSRWFVLVVTCAAVFVAAGKRLAELHRAAADQRTGRRVLGVYSASGLRAILAVSGMAALFAYCVWAFDLPSIHGIPWRPLTIVPFAVCLWRYASLLRSERGDSPEDLLLGDRPLAVAGLAWLILFALGVHAAD